MASALLSASFALYLVRERECCSKSVQMISGTPPLVFWLATFLWDILAFSIPAAGKARNLDQVVTEVALLSAFNSSNVQVYIFTLAE